MKRWLIVVAALLVAVAAWAAPVKYLLPTPGVV